MRVGCLGKEVGLVRAQAIFRLVVLSILCVSVLLPTRWVLATPALKPQSFSVAIGESLNRPPIPAAARGSVYTVNTKDLTAPGDGLPRGLDINRGTGTISGSVGSDVLPGVYKPRVSVTSSAGSTSAVYTITVTRQIVLGDVLAQIKQGDPVRIPAKIIGGHSLFNFRLAGKPRTTPGIAYPMGLSVDSKTGVLFGTVSYEVEYGVYNFLLWADEVVHGEIVSHFAYYTLLVSPMHFNVDDQNFELQAYKPFKFPLSANGAAIAWVATGLPKGIYLSPAGLLYGVPAVPPGEYSARLTVYGLEVRSGVLKIVSVTANLNILVAGEPIIYPQSITVKKGESVSFPPKPPHKPGWVYWANMVDITTPGNGIPDGLILSPDNGTLYGAVSPSVQPGVYTPTVFKAVPGEVEYAHSTTYTIMVVEGTAPGVN
ncbi:Ig domain-containing protein [Tropheryma whipplei]|uniref:Ig domain-containing protein n=1 Tax=Tropheryma whipplei TaxID=2039 RepID=UPI00053B1327|nr:Ig domain-containing protein [Tropheryma whipplei]